MQHTSTKVYEAPVNEMENSGLINIVLVGKTGNGKSLSGNTLLGRNVFESSSDFSSCTDECSLESVTIGSYIFNVVDTPGIMDTNLSETEILEKLFEIMSLCPEGFHAFIFVLKYGTRYTKEESDVFQICKKCFGPSFVKCCFLLITNGEDLEYELTKNKISLEEWYLNQEKIKTDFKECNNRVHLFYNLKEEFKDKREKSRQRLLEQILKHNFVYKSSDFKRATKEREKFAEESGYSQIKPAIQQRLSLISASVENINETSSEIELDIIRKQIQELNNYLQMTERNNIASIRLVTRIDRLQQALNNPRRNGKKIMEYLRLLKKPPLKWRLNLMTAIASMSAFFAFVSIPLPPLSGTLATVAIVSTAATLKYVNYTDTYEAEIKKLEEEIYVC